MSKKNLEQVLQNMNTLNRSLESVIAVRSSRCLFTDRSSHERRTPPTGKLWNEVQQTRLTRLGNIGRQRVRSSRRTVVHVRECHGAATTATADPRRRGTNTYWCSREGTRTLKSRTRERARGYKQGEERRHTMISRGNTTTLTNDDMIAAWLNEVDSLRMRREVVEGQREPVSHTTHKARTRNLTGVYGIQGLSQRLCRTQMDEASGRHHHITPHLEFRTVYITAIEHRIGTRGL
jgi:hypothetical protein